MSIRPHNTASYCPVTHFGKREVQDDKSYVLNSSKYTFLWDKSNSHELPGESCSSTSESFTRMRFAAITR